MRPRERRPRGRAAALRSGATGPTLPPVPASHGKNPEGRPGPSAGRNLSPRPAPAGSRGRDAGASGPPDWELVERPSLPQRYRRIEDEDGTHLTCDEAPRIKVRVQRDFAFSKAQARELGGRVILLDGVGSFGPLIDNKARLYNLDHHEGCERTFTLATCEQALLLVQSGLRLSEGDWSVYANEPDLDTVLAIWCLLNYARLRELRDESRDVLFPMLRLEGAIDANGRELAEFCGLPRRVLARTQERVDGLMALERDVKKTGEWQKVDLERYTLRALTEIDRLVYSIEDFREYASIEEVYGHTEIGTRRVAVACRDAAGIYEVERLLKARWGDQLAVIVLENEPGRYTLRRTATLSKIDLQPAYRMLNLLDPAVDGRPPGKRWGGSEAIGGSPRPTGSALGPRELLRTLATAYRPAARRRGVANAARAVAWSLFVGIVVLGAGLAWWLVPGLVDPARQEVTRVATSAGVALMAALVLTRRFSERRSWLFGFRRPAGVDWLPLAFVAALAALPARAWFPQDITPALVPFSLGVAAVALAALALECWFRGVVQGLLLFDGTVQTPGGPWLLSAATWVSALVYASFTLALSLPRIVLGPTRLLEPSLETLLVAASALVGGLALGAMRERSLSLWPGVLAQFAGGVGSLVFWLWLAG